MKPNYNYLRWPFIVSSKAHMHAHAHTYMQAHSHTNTHAHTHMHAHTAHTHTCMHADMLTYTHKCTCACTHNTHTHTYARMHARTHTRTHTHTHTNIRKTGYGADGFALHVYRVAVSGEHFDQQLKNVTIVVSHYLLVLVTAQQANSKAFPLNNLVTVIQHNTSLVPSVMINCTWCQVHSLTWCQVHSLTCCQVHSLTCCQVHLLTQSCQSQNDNYVTTPTQIRVKSLTNKMHPQIQLISEWYISSMKKIETKQKYKCK